MERFVGCLLLISCCNLTAQKTFIQVSNAAVIQANTPLRVQLTKPLPPANSYQLVNQKTGKPTTAQLIDSITLVFVTEQKMQAGNHQYLLVVGKKTNTQPPVSIVKKENGLLVQVKNRPVLFYHTKEAMPPADSPSYYRRSGFIHPLYSPSGKILTDDFPVGHAHQHAIFTAWVNTTFRNSTVDFWNQQSKKGTVEHIEVKEIIQGPVVAQIKTILRHKSLEHGEVLLEKWTITIYPTENYFLFDLESEQQNTTKDTLFLKTYHYGGLAFRGSRQWNHEDLESFKSIWNIITSEGYRDSAANATHARWVDAWGKVDNGTAGVTIFNHPSNFRYPQAIRVHPTMPYWAFAPVADGPMFIAPGAFYRSRFRCFIHDQQVPPTVIEKHFSAWADSLDVKVIEK